MNLCRARQRQCKDRHVGRDGAGTNQICPWEKGDLSLWQIDSVPGTRRLFSAKLHSKFAILFRLSLAQVGFVPGTTVPIILKSRLQSQLQDFIFIVWPDMFTLQYFFPGINFVITLLYTFSLPQNCFGWNNFALHCIILTTTLRLHLCFVYTT